MAVFFSDPDTGEVSTYADTIFELEDSRESTILDQNGNPYRISHKKRPIGFNLTPKSKGKQDDP